MAYQQPYQGPQGDHPQSTTILVLGILSLVICGFLGPVAWVMGNSAIKEIDASGGRIGGRGQVQAGRICGMIASALLAVGAVVLVIALAGGLAASNA